jgi:type IV pilus assembly protein PilA
METTLRRMREQRAGEDRGFTLIELLVVVVIIGVLVAIAVPMYLNYRKGAENKSAQSDIRGAVSAIEQFYTENSNVYPVDGNNSSFPGTNLVFGTTATGPQGQSGAGAGGTTETATVSSQNVLSYKNNGATYVICGYNTDGAQMYVYNSSNGGSVGKSNATGATMTAKLAACLSSGS